MTTRSQPVAQRRGQRGVVADAAGQLDRHIEPADHLGQQRRVGSPAERRVEVDEVDPLRAGPLPGQRRRQRVAVGRLGSRRALDEPDGLAAGDVHGGQQGQTPLT